MTAPAAIANGRPDYGIDAPALQRGFRYAGVALVVAGRMFIERGVMQSVGWAQGVGTAMMWAGLWFFITGSLMYMGSRVGKLLLRNKILNSIEWRGDEQVLDVGCGHGLMLLGSAKHLASGHAVGVDIWSQVDQKDNSAEATLENARREGVAERVELKTADARELPFPDNSFDVIVSSFAIHNICGSAGRESAIREIARVLKPGGQLALADIRYTRQYEKLLQSLGWQQTQRWFPSFVFVTPTRVLRATKP
jgi:SAM-dependent methyltransferase